MSETPSNTPEENMRSSAASTAMVMVLTTVSRLMGFVRLAVFNAVFGASGYADVLNAVFNIPHNLRKLLAEGALSSAFIPVLSQAVGRGQEEKAREMVRSLLTFQYLVLIPVLVLSVVFAGPITSFILDFPEAERMELAGDLFRWFVHYTLLISVSAVLMGALNSRRRFVIPATTPIVFSVVVIASILTLYQRLGVYAMAAGVLVGGIGQVLFQLPQFVRNGFDLRLSFSFQNLEFRTIIRRWFPVVAASSIFAINQQIALFFASGLADGSASAMVNAVIFWQLPQGIFAVSITTVLFPRMSRQAGAGDRDGLRETISYGLRGMIALLVPSAVILGLLGEPIIAMAFQRGEFTATNTLMAGQVLRGYCWGLLSVSAFNFMQRFFYSWGDYRFPTYVALGCVVTDVVLSLWLKETRLGVAGLAVANSVAFSAGLVALVVRARTLTRGLDGRRLAGTSLKAVAAGGVAGGLLFLADRVLGRWWIDGSSARGFGLLAALGVGALVVVGGAYYLMREEVVTMILRRRRS